MICLEPEYIVRHVYMCKYITLLTNATRVFAFDLQGKALCLQL